MSEQCHTSADTHLRAFVSYYWKWFTFSSKIYFVEYFRLFNCSENSLLLFFFRAGKVSTTCQLFHNFSWKILEFEAKLAVFYRLLFQAFRGLPSDFFLTVKKSTGENQVTPQIKKLFFLTNPSLVFHSVDTGYFPSTDISLPCTLSSFLSPFKIWSNLFYRALTNLGSSKICWLLTVNSLQETVTCICYKSCAGHEDLGCHLLPLCMKGAIYATEEPRFPVTWSGTEE